ncbi:hypothetical protein JW935_06120 [candidate division KSB1 bacterium]|nr:hypothetical protein [candidate division KSB1 bacterium]
MERRKRFTTAPSSKIQNVLDQIKRELKDSILPVSFHDLNSFERKLIHRHFDHNSEIVTKTYRHDEDYELKVYPVGNLKRYAHEKASEAVEKGERIVLPHMGNYERFIIHDTLKSNEAVKSESYGEGDERHIEIEPEMFGRGLKKIIRKIRLF